MKNKTFNGVAASPGIIMGEAYVFDSKKHIVEKVEIEQKDVPGEIERLEDSLEKSKAEILDLKDSVNREIGESQAAIFNFHYLMLSDPHIINTAKKKIESDLVTAEYAIQSTFDKIISNIANLDNAYIRERQADYSDICTRILNNLSGLMHTTLKEMDKRSIIISHDLSPSDTANMDRSKVLGFAVEIGGPTSHTVIMAKAFEIPAVVAIDNLINYVRTGDQIIVDGLTGTVIVNPDTRTLKKYQKKKYEFDTFEKSLYRLSQLKAKTLDNADIDLQANIELPDEIEHVKKHGAQGIGLFRTEFLFLRNQEFPTEEEQFVEYKKVVEAMAPKKVIIRTYDIGGDKFLSSTPFSDEMNPFLGLRAIRLCLKNPQIFREHLRAILRASSFGKLKILLPMISGLDELHQAKKVIESVKKELTKEKIKFDKNIQIGAMIEIPSAAVTADLIAKEVDFFSIGTNDLIQYMLAVDRVNEKVSYLYDPLHPAVLRLMKHIVDCAHKNNIWCGVCGEMAAQPLFAFILIGFGVDELSMSSIAIPDVKRMIRNIRLEDAKKFADKILKMSDSSKIRKEAEKKLLQLIPDMILV